ncbi:MAG: acetyl-CoA carboxylase carboxyltransferase subunit beta [Alphaproteobacteria bacterium]|nr:acetyl-CoA carboxylase carboxyltransferase subunit beta [Alphaproteobacteria bacterium]
MNWLTEYVRPKLNKFLKGDSPIPENLWQRCPGCGEMLFHRDLGENLYVCHHCNHHLRISAQQRLEMLFDNAHFELIDLPEVLEDPLKFKDSKKYSDRLKTYREKTNNQDALLVGEGKIKGHLAVVAAFDFTFMGGSMGLFVGEGLVTAAQRAVNKKVPLIVIPASGGARMQEGILSLMQMPRTTVAVQMLRQKKLPYIVLLTDPTTGGVSASFAMLGDITIAEPKATIGFAGARVIEETIREKLPEGFQTSEYLLDHGMVDCIVNRKDLPKTIGTLISMINA